MRKANPAYVRAKKLKKPAVIGHSLGAFMAFDPGTAEPDLFGPLVAVEGVPFDRYDEPRWLNYHIEYSLNENK